MNLNKEVAQYQSELKYSKKNLINIVLGSMNAQDNTDVKFKLVKKINEYLHGDYWANKNDIITAILMTNINPVDIAEHIIISSLKHPNTVINNIANAVGELFSEFIGDIFTRVQIGADLLLACEDIIYDLVVTSNDGILFNSWIELNSKERLLVSKLMYQPPMKVVPLHVNNNFMSGYYTFNESVILGNKYCNHNKRVSLDVLNIQSKIALELDKEVIKLKHKSKEELTGQDKENWGQYVIEQEMLFKEYSDDEFYYCWKFDSRGRLYSSGHHLNFQGDEYQKAMINLAKKEICI